MAEIGSRRGAVNVAVILAIVAIVAVGGLIYWLEITAVPTQREVVEEDTGDEPPVLDVPIVRIEAIREEPEGYQGIEVAVRNEEINSRLGEQGVWVGPDDNPFLVKLNGPAASTAAEMEIGDRVHLRGFIYAMSDSVLDAWEEEGAISGEGERAVASFAEQFLDASEIEPAQGGGEQQDGGPDGSADNGQ